MIATAILIMVVGQTAPDQPWAGQLVSAVGPVVLERDRQQFTADRRAGLLVGDHVRTAVDGGASFFFDDGVFVYMGADSSLEIADRKKSGVRIESGEVRVVSQGPTRLELVAPPTRINVSQGTLRAQVTKEGVRIWSEHGTANGTLSNGQAFKLVAGKEVFLTKTNQIRGPRPAQRGDWQLNVRTVQYQGTADALRQRDQQAQQSTNGQSGSNTDEEQRRRDQQTARANTQRGSNMRRPPATQNQTAATGGTSSFAGFSAGAGLAASGGLFSDAAQDTLVGKNIDDNDSPFPGNIHTITTESRYDISKIKLTAAEKASMFPGGTPAYYSIGVGNAPSGQVTTDFNTGTNIDPHFIKIPKQNAYILRLDQYGAIDSALYPTAALNSNVGYTGLLGADPVGPTATNATPLADNRAQLNEKVTFALGEVRVRPDGGSNGNSFELAVRRSDQDRLIQKDPNGNDANDLVQPNTQVQFDNVVDPRFLPAAPTVKVPQTGSFDSQGTRFSELNNLRRAAVTTVMGDQLYDYARRTGQTRFVVDGKIVDITGFRRK